MLSLNFQQQNGATEPEAKKGKVETKEDKVSDYLNCIYSLVISDHHSIHFLL